jgi:phage baseplate assembly protein W
VADSHLLTDIRLELRRNELRPVYAVATAQRRVPKTGTRVDLATMKGRENLGQAVVLRLLTPRGELAALGHPTYGSRLHELVGRQNTETTRNLVKLHILESLQQEARIAKVTRLDVQPSPGTRDRVDVLLVVEPAGAAQSVTIGPFTLELEA